MNKVSQIYISLFQKEAEIVETQHGSAKFFALSDLAKEFGQGVVKQMLFQYFNGHLIPNRPVQFYGVLLSENFRGVCDVWRPGQVLASCVDNEKGVIV